METRASHMLIGGFVLVLVAALFAMVIWLARVQIDHVVKNYDIFFRGSVAGLGVGGDVRYRGIRVGTVNAIAIDPEDPRRVRVRVEIDGNTPIRKGDRAQLQLQGITGVSFINIGGAEAAAELLQPAEGQEVAVIPSKPSDIARLLSSAPQLMNRAIVVAERLAALASDENRENLTLILADTRQFTETLVAQQDRLVRILAAVDRSSGDVAAAVANVRDLSAKADTLIDETSATLSLARGAIAGADAFVQGDVKDLIAEIQATAKSVAKLSDDADRILAENREPLHDFAADGLPEF